MRMLMRGGSAAALAAGLSIMLSAGALAQDAPAGCVASGNPNGAAAGAVVGGVAGALLGNAVSGKHKAPGTILGGVTGALAGAAIGGSSGAPCPQGYVYRNGPPPERVDLDSDEPRPSRDGDFWDGAPPRIHERISFLRRRVQMLDHDGWLSPRESEGLFHRLGEIDRREVAIRDRNDGVLPPEVREHLNDDLNEVARRLRWKEYRTEHASE